MSGNVSFIVELEVKPGLVDELRGVMREMVDLARSEPGTLNYEWFRSSDGTTCHVYERQTRSVPEEERLRSPCHGRFLASAGWSLAGELGGGSAASTGQAMGRE